MRLSRGHRHWVYWSGAALCVTWAIWLVYRFFLREHGEFGEPHPMEEWWLRLHGTAAVLMLVIAGSLLPVHVRVGWPQRKNLLAGCILVAILVLLIVSGYALYYSDEGSRPVISALHWIIGLGAPVALIWHIVRGRGMHTTSDDLVGPRQARRDLLRAANILLTKPNAKQVIHQVVRTQRSCVPGWSQKRCSRL